jgi:hypothetical protein
MAGLLCKQKRELVPIVVPRQCAAAALAQRAAEAAAAPVACSQEDPEAARGRDARSGSVLLQPSGYSGPCCSPRPSVALEMQTREHPIGTYPMQAWVHLFESSPGAPLLGGLASFLCGYQVILLLCFNTTGESSRGIVCSEGLRCQGGKTPLNFLIVSFECPTVSLPGSNPEVQFTTWRGLRKNQSWVELVLAHGGKH